MMAIVAPVSQKTVMSAPGPPVPGHDTHGGSQGAASSGGVWAAQPRQGRHQETRHSTPLRCSLCGLAAVLLCQLLTTSNTFENLFSSQFMELISLLSHTFSTAQT